MMKKSLSRKQKNPVGRIEYLGSNGKTVETIEYSDVELFIKNIKEDNYYGIPMVIVLYKDKKWQYNTARFY